MRRWIYVSGLSGKIGPMAVMEWFYIQITIAYWHLDASRSASEELARYHHERARQRLFGAQRRLMASESQSAEMAEIKRRIEFLHRSLEEL